jgi:hypothetical protein
VFAMAGANEAHVTIRTAVRRRLIQRLAVRPRPSASPASMVPTMSRCPT